MASIRTRISFLFLALASVVLAACPPHESIAKINQDPARYAGKEIRIAGRVDGSFGAFGKGAFRVDDGTGEMWVVTGQFGVPENGTKVTVAGHIEQGVTFAGRNFAVILRETEARH